MSYALRYIFCQCYMPSSPSLTRVTDFLSIRIYLVLSTVPGSFQILFLFESSQNKTGTTAPRCNPTNTKILDRCMWKCLNLSTGAFLTKSFHRFFQFPFIGLWLKSKSNSCGRSIEQRVCLTEAARECSIARAKDGRDTRRGKEQQPQLR